MPKGSAELTQARREEIIDACASLYQSMPFREITIKEIGKVTSFTRTSIYNYFNTKEEIFLAFLQREYNSWTNDLKQIYQTHETLSIQELAQSIAHSVAERSTMLKLLSTNLFEIEENSRLDNLVDFKVVYKDTLESLARLFKKACPQKTDKDIESLLYAFLPFVFGIHPYVAVTDKQREAMIRVGLNFKQYSIYEITYSFLLQLMSCGDNE